MDRCGTGCWLPQRKASTAARAFWRAFQDVIGPERRRNADLGRQFRRWSAGTGSYAAPVTGAVMVLDLLDPADPADVIDSKKRSVGPARSRKAVRECLRICGARIFTAKKFVPDDTTLMTKALGLTGHCDIMIAGGRDCGADAGGATIL